MSSIIKLRGRSSKKKIRPESGRPLQGFTLLEVLVAMIITGLVVTVFFQLLSAGLRLEYRADQGTQGILDLGQAWTQVIAQDVREDDFQWEGELEQGSWSLEIEPVETEMRAWRDLDQEHGLQLSSELYRYIFSFRSAEDRQWALIRYVRYDPDFFSDEFKRIHFD